MPPSKRFSKRMASPKPPIEDAHHNRVQRFCFTNNPQQIFDLDYQENLRLPQGVLNRPPQAAHQMVGGAGDAKRAYLVQP